MNKKEKMNLGKLIRTSQKGISLISLVVTIITIIILASISIWTGMKYPDQSIQSDHLYELSQVQEYLDIKRMENEQYESRNHGFKSIKIENAPADFVSISKEGTVGYVVDLEYINAKDCKNGKEYKTLNYESDTVTFGKSDVYVYDKNGKVYYAKGIALDDEGNTVNSIVK